MGYISLQVNILSAKLKRWKQKQCTSLRIWATLKGAKLSWSVSRTAVPIKCSCSAVISTYWTESSLRSVHTNPHWKCLQWAHQHQNWDNGRRCAGLTSHFFFFFFCIIWKACCVAYLRKRWWLDALLQEVKPAVTVWCFETMFCWETMGPAIHVDEKYHLPKYCCRPETSLHTVFPNGSGLVQQDDVLSHTAKMDQEWGEEHNSELKVRLGLQIVIYSSIWDVLDKQVCRTEGSNVYCVVADTVALLQRSCGVHSSTGQSCVARRDACNVMAHASLSTC